MRYVSIAECGIFWFLMIYDILLSNFGRILYYVHSLLNQPSNAKE